MVIWHDDWLQRPSCLSELSYRWYRQSQLTGSVSVRDGIESWPPNSRIKSRGVYDLLKLVGRKTCALIRMFLTPTVSLHTFTSRVHDEYEVHT